MKQNKSLPVIFRMEKCCGEWKPLAVFPTTELSDNGYRFMTCLCYSHIGQHSCICHDNYSEKTKPATKEQYEPLLKELTNVECFSQDDADVFSVFIPKFYSYEEPSYWEEYVDMRSRLEEAMGIDEETFEKYSY